MVYPQGGIVAPDCNGVIEALEGAIGHGFSEDKSGSLTFCPCKRVPSGDKVDCFIRRCALDEEAGGRGSGVKELESGIHYGGCEIGTMHCESREQEEESEEEKTSEAGGRSFHETKSRLYVLATMGIAEDCADSGSKDESQDHDGKSAQAPAMADEGRAFEVVDGSHIEEDPGREGESKAFYGDENGGIEDLKDLRAGDDACRGGNGEDSVENDGLDAAESASGHAKGDSETGGAFVS